MHSKQKNPCLISSVPIVDLIWLWVPGFPSASKTVDGETAFKKKTQQMSRKGEVRVPNPSSVDPTAQRRMFTRSSSPS